mmetsp:Transcript_10246/g.25089  ORF Transcript_10246/g.25089 Transcript_10246/m.25089 type:complete len:439 (-) Transcript_10246:230-1546(-)
MAGRAGMYHKGIGSDTHHKGMGQAGNKSTLSYRADIGVPGYTGYIPSSSSIQVPIKGSTQHIGKDAGAQTARRLAATATADAVPQSLYTTMSKTLEPEAYGVPKKTGGGYWIGHGDANSNGQSKPFIAGTTYKHEVCETARRPEQVALSSPRGMKASIFPTHTSLAAMKTARHEQWPAAGGDAVGYTSEYDRMVVKDPLTGGLVAAGSPRRGESVGAATARTAMEKGPRRMRVTRVTEPRFDGTTVYAANYGDYGSDPLARSATNETGITQCASTGEFNLGTTRATRHVPGYSGFINKAHYNSTAVAAAGGELSRPAEKDSMLLSALDQFSRGSVPQYGGFRPQVPLNIQPSQGPIKTTTSGHGNYQATKLPLKPLDNANFHNIESGVMSFFTAGTLSVSDNGIANAERYYAHVRPKEGLPRIHYPSQTTGSGYRFHN